MWSLHLLAQTFWVVTPSPASALFIKHVLCAAVAPSAGVLQEMRQTESSPSRVLQSFLGRQTNVCSAQSLRYLTLCDPLDCSPPGSSVHGDSPGKNTGVGFHFLLQEIFLTLGSNPHFLCLLYRQAESLSLCQTENNNTKGPDNVISKSVRCALKEIMQVKGTLCVGARWSLR